MVKIVFKLYVFGRTASSEMAVANLRRICKEGLPAKIEPEVEVIDLRECPEMAEEEKILATPTLVKASPLPTLRLVGDLSDIPRVLRDLGLKAKDSDWL